MQNEKHVCTPDCKHGCGNKTIWFAVIALIVIVGGGYALSRDGDKSGSSKSQKNVVEQEAPKNTGTIVAGSYESYDTAKLAKAKNSNVVLFFHASWCPTCQALDRDLKANADAIPANLTVLDIDYDTATELKKKYGVVMQSTFVQVDENGNQLKKWSESTTLADLVSRVN